MSFRSMIIPARGDIRIETADVDPTEINLHIHDVIGDFFRTRPIGKRVAGLAPVMYFSESGKGQMNARASILNQNAGGVSAIYGTALITALDENRNQVPLTDELIAAFGLKLH